MEKQRKVQDKGKDLIGQMMTVSDSLRSNLDILRSNIGQEIQKQLTTTFTL